MAKNPKNANGLKISNSKNRPLLIKQPAGPSTRKTPTNRSLSSDPDPKPAKPREITYRIGWRQGTIRADGMPRAPMQADNGKGAAAGKTGAKFRFDLWREAPNMSLGIWLLCLYALPVVTAIAVLWLILVLQQ